MPSPERRRPASTPTALADLEEERAWLLAAKRHPSPQPGRHQRIEREPLALSLALAQHAQAAAPRIKVLKVELHDLTTAQGAAVAQQQEYGHVARCLGPVRLGLAHP